MRGLYKPKLTEGLCESMKSRIGDEFDFEHTGMCQNSSPFKGQKEYKSKELSHYVPEESIEWIRENKEAKDE